MDASQDKSELLEQEYTEFVRIVAHDLAVPLRHVREFTRLLVEAREKGPGEQEEDYIDFLDVALRKLDDMQKALLAFSRVNTRGAEFRATDCNILAEKVLSGLRAEIEQRPTTIACGELPTVMADSAQILSAFTSLIDNALKFHAPGAQDRCVWITATEDGNSYRFEIGDNGIGIEPDLREAAFRLFRQLNNDAYPGIGAGLTIAQKIVRRHGGDLALEPRVGGGTNAIFWLPK